MRVAMNLEQLLQPQPGGTGRYAARLAAHLPAEGVEVVALTAAHGPAAVRAALAANGLSGTAAHMLPVPRPVLYDAWVHLGWLPVGLCLPPLPPVDLVHAPSPAVPPRGRRPLVVTVHDAAPLTHPQAFTARGLRFHRAGFAAAAQRADLVLTVSDFARRELVDHAGFDPDRVRVVPHGIDPPLVPADEAPAVLGSLAERPYVLFVGTVEPRKGIELLLDAWPALGTAGAGHRLVVAGRPGWGSTPAAVGEAEAAGRLVWLRGAGDRMLSALYRGATAVVLPSRHEGFGLPVLEAMAHGTPVVCSSAGALPEVAGGAAEVVQAGDAASWAEAIAAVLADDGRRRRLAAAGLQRAAGFSWPGCARATAAAYRDAASTPRRPGPGA